MPAVTIVDNTVPLAVLLEAIPSQVPSALLRSNDQPRLHQIHGHFLYPRDPGASDPVLGGVIVASVTVGILAMVALAVCVRRQARSRYYSGHSDDSDIISVHNQPSGPSEEPKRPSLEIRKTKASGLAFVRRKPPREESQNDYPDFHDPLSTHY